MTSSNTSNKHRLTGRNFIALSAVGVLFTWTLLCFCSFLPFVLLLSFLFNALYLGSSLFSALAQEREKRTIDALRLTQLSSLDILTYKAHSELKAWKLGNLAFLSLAALGAIWSTSPFLWAVGGAAALAAGGLLSIALALAVSTRCETTSSAVVSGWVSKGVWLVGLPVLDYVVEAVLVLSKELNFFSYLDPAWIFRYVINGLFFETSGWSLGGLLLGAVAMAAVAFGLLIHSSRLIDSSFESAATLEDRSRHTAYSKSFLFGLHKNPFMVREMAWQMRTGAGAWPGYAVFLTLFLAPFLYGLAQQQKAGQRTQYRVVRQNVSQTAVSEARGQRPSSHTRGHYNQEEVYRSDERHCGTASVGQTDVRYHNGLCLSRMMGLPVPTKLSAHYSGRGTVRPGERIVVQSDGKVQRVSETVAQNLKARSDQTDSADYHSYRSRSQLQMELDRGLLTGLVLTLLYLFVRGGAFMSGAVTGEKERRAWDQIALTGVSPEDYLFGKLAGVLYFPLKQLLLTSPVLILFGLYGGVSLLEVVLIVPMLVASFLAAACIGLLSSSTQETSHQAQGKALIAAGAILAAPLLPGGFLLAGLLTFAFLGGTALEAGEKTLAAAGVTLWMVLCGTAASPLAAAMQACRYDGIGPLGLIAGSAPPLVFLLLGTLSMSAVAYGAFKLAVRGLEQGGSVRV